MTDKEWTDLLEKLEKRGFVDVRGGDAYSDDCPLCKTWGHPSGPPEEIPGTGFKVWISELFRRD